MKKSSSKSKTSGKSPPASERRRQAVGLGAIPHYPFPNGIPGFPGLAMPVLSGGTSVASASPQQPPRPDVRPDENVFIKAMRDIATAAWKLKGIVFKPGTDELATLDAAQLADIGYYAERLYNSLAALGVTVLDFTGQPFHAGMPVKVISAKPVPGLEQEIVFQTLLPTLGFKTGEFYPGNVITLKREDEEVSGAQEPSTPPTPEA